MAVLLTYMVLVEPDIQQLSRFILDSVDKLGGNRFKASASLIGFFGELRAACCKKGVALETQLVLNGRQLELRWDGGAYVVDLLPEEHSSAVIDELAMKLRHESEMADPELLRARNEKISNNLEIAKAKAADEMSELESILERKKRELWVTSRQAETDSLTGLYNRGAYDTYLKKAISDCKRKPSPMSLILLDLDNFKEINDTHGHQYGDEYIKRLARIMANSCRTRRDRRETDIACRIGGDEFAIIVSANIKIACRIAEKILQAFNYKVSVGVSELKKTDDAESIVSRCDNALYHAKEAGRGQVKAA